MVNLNNFNRTSIVYVMNVACLYITKISPIFMKINLICGDDPPFWALSTFGDKFFGGLIPLQCHISDKIKLQQAGAEQCQAQQSLSSL